MVEGEAEEGSVKLVVLPFLDDRKGAEARVLCVNGR